MGAEKCACVGSCAGSVAALHPWICVSRSPRSLPDFKFKLCVLYVSPDGKISLYPGSEGPALAMRGSVPCSVLLDSLQDLAVSVLGFVERRVLANPPVKSVSDLNTWLTSLFPSCLGVPRVLEQGRAVPWLWDSSYEIHWVNRADALAGTTCRNCCQSPALEQSPLILCCILHPCSHSSERLARGGGRSQPAAGFLQSRADPSTRAWGALAAKPSW